MQVFSSDNHRRHDAVELSRGKLQVSVESPRRVDIIRRSLSEAGHDVAAPGELDIALVRQIHAAEYVEFLSGIWARWQAQFGDDTPAMPFAWPSRHAAPERPKDVVGQLGYHSFAADCSIGEGTWDAATAAAAAAQSAADHVATTGEATYALSRPPGHHATHDQFGGYCFLNNSAIAAQRLLNHGRSRVAVVDIDYHHGNGTQDIFYRRSDVLTVSVHADPMSEFPWFAGYDHERGAAAGEGWNLNIPLSLGADYSAWSAAIDKAAARVADSNAEALVIAFGADTFVDDPLGTFSIETQNYVETGEKLASLTLPTVIVQEGGYAVQSIGENVAALLEGFR
ncbi:MAG: histone deacetylase family protein [Pseudomonadota bacterium]